MIWITQIKLLQIDHRIVRQLYYDRRQIVIDTAYPIRESKESGEIVGKSTLLCCFFIGFRI